MAQLQRFSFKDSPYQRPTQKWICGRMAEGTPCHIGPDNNGTCRETSECRPRKDGSRWYCTRSQLSGGPCKSGPLPNGDCCNRIPKCRPTRSWRAKRGALTRWVTAVTVGIVLLCLSSGSSQHFINPGNLTAQHAELSDCSNCHAGSSLKPAEWLHAAFVDSSAREDNEKCISCHKLGENSLNPHGLEHDAIASLTLTAAITDPSKATMSTEIANALFEKPNAATRTLSCSTCHSEHHGTEFDLTFMSDASCNSCHTAQFASFSEGHPPYLNYPYERRTRIQFDHLSHFGKHFTANGNQGEAFKDCGTCHEPDSAGQLMQVKSFDAICGACHGSQIEGEGRASAKGIAVLSVPGIDVYTLQDHAVGVGEWPEDAEGPITPFMELLLSTQDEYRTARSSVEGVDLMDLMDANEDQIGAVKNIVWSVKGLFFDLRVNGLTELKKRLETVFGRELMSSEVAQLSALVPLGVIQSAQEEWFPNLLVEVSRYRNGETVLMLSEAETDSSVASESDFPDQSVPGDDEIDLGDDEIDLGDDEIDLGDDEIDLGDDEIDLGDDEIDLGDDEIDLGDDEIDLGDSQAAIENGNELEKALLPLPINDEDWASAGGWYQDNNTFSLRYRPIGHADQFIQTWLDVTSHSLSQRDSTLPTNPSAQKVIDEIFEELVDTKTPGVCTKCHSVDQSQSNARAVNWRGFRSYPNQHSFTKFSHETHFSLLDEKGCVTCHTINAEANFSAGFDDRDPTTFASNFNPLEQAVCAGCHQAKKASDGCLTCHNYHVGDFPPAVPTTKEMLTVSGE